MSSDPVQLQESCLEAPEVVALPDGTSGGHSRSGMLSYVKSRLKQGTFVLVDQGICSANTFISGIVIGRSLSKDHFGLYMLGLTLVVLLTDFQTAAISTPYMINRAGRSGAEALRYAGATLCRQLLLSLIAAILLIVASFAMPLAGGSPALALVLRLLSVLAAAMLLREYLRRFCFAELRFGQALAIDASSSILQIGGLLLISWLGWLSLGSAIVTLAVPLFVCSLIYLGLSRSRFQLTLGNFRKELLADLSMGKWIIFSGVLWSVNAAIYPWMLMVFNGSAVTADWGVCRSLMNVLSPISLGLGNYVGPKLARAYSEGGIGALSRSVVRSIAAFLICLLPCCVALIMMGDRAIGILYGKGYSGNRIVLTLLALNTLLVSITFPLSRALFAVKRADFDFLCSGVGFLTSIVSAIVFTRCFGLVGAAMALFLWTCAESTMRAIMFLKLRRSRRV